MEAKGNHFYFNGIVDTDIPLLTAEINRINPKYRPIDTNLEVLTYITGVSEKALERYTSHQLLDLYFRVTSALVRIHRGYSLMFSAFNMRGVAARETRKYLGCFSYFSGLIFINRSLVGQEPKSSNRGRISDDRTAAPFSSRESALSKLRTQTRIAEADMSYLSREMDIPLALMQLNPGQETQVANRFLAFAQTVRPK